MLLKHSFLIYQVTIFSELGKNKLTVGKIYAGLLILESWRTTRFGQIESTGAPVSL